MRCLRPFIFGLRLSSSQIQHGCYLTNVQLWHVYLKRGAGELISPVVSGYQCFGIRIWCVYREGRGTEVWRSCLGRRAGRLQPVKHKGRPRVNRCSLNQRPASYGPNGTWKDILKINKPISCPVLMRSGFRDWGGMNHHSY